MTMNPRWGATVNCGPGTRAVLGDDQLREFAHRALALGAGLSIAETETGYVADLAARRGSQRIRVTGPLLPSAIAEALERFANGASDAGIAFRAGADGIAHGHAGRTWTLCKRTAVQEQYRHPETSRCRECLRALDTRVAA